MNDLLILAFLPWVGALLAGAAAPAALVARALYRRRARRRNSSGRCGRCYGEWTEGVEGGVFVVDGIYVCESCAERLRRRLRVVLPALGIGVVIAAAFSALGFLFGGPPLEWWFSGALMPRFVIIVAPTVLLGGGLILRLRLGKKANQRELKTTSDPVDMLESRVATR